MSKSIHDVLNTMNNEFRGPETEETWKKRQDLCILLSDILEKRHADRDYPKDLFEKIKHIMGPIVQTATSERTTLSSQACKLVNNLSIALGSQIHPFLDMLLQTMIDHCGSTKPINQKNGNEVILTIIKNAGFNTRLLYHVCATSKDKRVPTRISAPLWLHELMRTYGRELDPHRDYDQIDKAIVAGLNDSQVKVRENTRQTYWRYAKLHDNRAEDIMAGLNPHAASALRDDKHNPNKDLKESKSSRPPRPASALAQIRTQSKQRMQKVARDITPMSTHSDDAVFGSLLNQPQNEKESSVTSEEVRPSSKESKHKDNRPTAFKESNPAAFEKSKQSTTARPLLSAPVRRPRIVATPISTGSQPTPRPLSRGEATKRIVDMSGRRTPVIAEDKEITTPSSAQSLKKSASRRPEESRSTKVLPLRHQKASSTSEVPTIQRQERPPLEKSATTHVPEGKENANAEIPNPLKKRVMVDSLDTARLSLSRALQGLRQGSLDALGYRKIKKLVEEYQGNLITSHEQFDELYEYLISNMASFEELTEKHSTNINHPHYNRHTMIAIIINLLQQYPQYGEPRPGMTLCALLTARGNHQSDKHPAVVESMTLAAGPLCSKAADPLPMIDAVLQTLMELESIILRNDPITAPGSFTELPPKYTSTASATGTRDFSQGSIASEFGAQKPVYPQRLPEVMGFGLQILIALLRRAQSLNVNLNSVQEDNLASFAEHCLATYNSIIKRKVMGFCIILYHIIKPEKKFYSYFSKEADRNLIHYYVAGAPSLPGVSTVAVG